MARVRDWHLWWSYVQELLVFFPRHVGSREPTQILQAWWQATVIH